MLVLKIVLQQNYLIANQTFLCLILVFMKVLIIFQHAFSESLLAENVDLLNIMPGAVETKNTSRFLKKAKPFTVSASDYAKKST